MTQQPLRLSAAAARLREGAEIVTQNCLFPQQQREREVKGERQTQPAAHLATHWWWGGKGLAWVQKNTAHPSSS